MSVSSSKQVVYFKISTYNILQVILHALLGAKSIQHLTAVVAQFGLPKNSTVCLMLRAQPQNM